MQKKNVNDVARRAWNILRLALLWARKGGAFKRRFMMDLRVVPKFLKNIGRNSPRGQLYYREYELSFDKTPVFHVKMHRPSSMRFSMPCITPQVDFDYGSDDEVMGDQNDNHQDGSVYEYYDGTRRSFFLKGGEDEEEECETCEENIPEEEEGIDMRAEEFIAKFRQQMMLQRQISYLQYHETPKKGTS
ncbi:AVR9/CF-9 RAPIDLY ELICITED PROTEIN-RELATED [Salix viminalis]|uniref:AVR9/CF-9 RAPIDLY ELICITED PROTEIN-RELATED n=1 Tax=Salix viminalis TaxID=40686 RepID=A0A6N2MCN3_SALVM|nr:AVR9/CF-9 RAPIDLY ELICITED PROTEIN-RELATED [Salix viminalis]